MKRVLELHEVYEGELYVDADDKGISISGIFPAGSDCWWDVCPAFNLDRRQSIAFLGRLQQQLSSSWLAESLDPFSSNAREDMRK